jgi:hypothetical protein
MEEIMHITVGKYDIDSDAAQFILSQKRITGEKANTPGEETKTIIGYYSTLESLFKALPTRMLMRSDAVGFVRVLDEIKEYRLMIEKAIKGV